MECYNLKTDFGAKGDGITDDNVSILNFIKNCMIYRKPGYIPPGRYLSSSRILLNADDQPDSRTGIHLFGAGTHASVFVITDSVAPSFHVYKNSGGVFSYCNFTDFSIECDSSQGFVVCLSNYTDWLGNGVFKNLHVYNKNSNKEEFAVAFQMNYIFDCIVENCVFITGTDFDNGIALELRNAKFTVFNGNSYSNAKYGILMSYSDDYRGCENLTFNSADFENTNYCIRNLSPLTRGIIFNTPYFDNRRPFTSELGIACISSPPQGEKSCLVFNNPRFAYPGSGLYPDLDKAVDINNSNPGAIKISGYYPGYSFTQPDTSPYTLNNGPQTIIVIISYKNKNTSYIATINNIITRTKYMILNPGDKLTIEWWGENPELNCTPIY